MPCASVEPPLAKGYAFFGRPNESTVRELYGISMMRLTVPSGKVNGPPGVVSVASVDPTVDIVMVLLDERVPLVSRIVVSWAKKGDDDI